jgi:hypothetical protein
MQIAEAALEPAIGRNDPRQGYAPSNVSNGSRSDELTSRLELPTVDLICPALGIERRWLRDAAVRTIRVADPRTSNLVEYATRIRALVAGPRYPAELSLRPATQYLTTPSDGQWGKLSGRTTPQGECLRWATIHAVNGQQFPAVALVIQDRLRKGTRRPDRPGPLARRHRRRVTAGPLRRRIAREQTPHARGVHGAPAAAGDHPST